MEIHLIAWQDACSVDEWQTVPESIVEGALHSIVSVGFVVHETDDLVMLCAAWDAENDQVAQTMTIPKGWIQTREVIRK